MDGLKANQLPQKTQSGPQDVARAGCEIDALDESAQLNLIGINLKMILITIVVIILCAGGLWVASLPTSYPKKRKTGRRTWPGRTAKLTRWRRDGGKIYMGKSSTEFTQKAVRALAETEREGNGVPAEVVLAKLEAKLAAARVLLQAKKGGVS